jgi:membrane associated rhomboid family serine protease
MIAAVSREAATKIDMLPLRDDIPSRTFPSVTVFIIVVNVIAFLNELRLGPYLENFLRDYALVPIRYTDGEIGGHFSLFEQATPFFTSMFLHGGWLHLIGNMWTLWIFGDNTGAILACICWAALLPVSCIFSPIPTPTSRRSVQAAPSRP